MLKSYESNVVVPVSYTVPKFTDTGPSWMLGLLLEVAEDDSIGAVVEASTLCGVNHAVCQKNVS